MAQTNSTHPGEILLVNVRTRSAMVIDEYDGRITEVPLDTQMTVRDDDTSSNTIESIPKAGTKIRLSYDENGPHIVGVNTQVWDIKNRQENELRKKVTNVNAGDPLLFGIVTDDLSPMDAFIKTGVNNFGSSDPLYKKETGRYRNFAGNSYEDLMPGDKVIATKDGNMIGVLEGGVNYFKASELCQIIGIRYDDLLRVVSRNFEQFTDFGNITIKNKDGFVNYSIEGASTQSEVKSGKYTLHIDMGYTGDLYKISVTNGSSDILSSFHMKSDGSIVEECKNLTTIVRGDSIEHVHGNKTLRIAGKYDLLYKGDQETTIDGNETTKVSNNKIVGVKNDYIDSTGRNRFTNIGGIRKESIAGDIIGLGTGDADVYDLVAGNKKETIKTKGDFLREVKISGSFVDKTLLGDFIRETTSGDFQERTTSGSLSRETMLGDISDTTSSGDLSRETSNGGISDTCSLGDFDVSVENGDYTLEVKKLLSGGNIYIKNDKVTVTIKNDGTVEIDADSTVDILGTKITLNAGGSVEKMTLGETLKSYIDTEIIAKFNLHQHTHPFGPTTGTLPSMTPSTTYLSTKNKND